MLCQVLASVEGNWGIPVPLKSWDEDSSIHICVFSLKYSNWQELLGKPIYIYVLKGICGELKICRGKLDPYSRPDLYMVSLPCSILESTCWITLRFAVRVLLSKTSVN